MKQLTGVVNVIYPDCTATLGISQTEINAGETATLTWNTANLTDVEITPYVGLVEASGQIKISPEFTTTYTLTGTAVCWSGNQTVSEAISLNVVYPACTATLDSSSAEITAGDSVTLTWSTTNATDVVINPDVGMVGATGQVTITPADTTTYTLTATGHGESATADKIVKVHFPMTPPETIVFSNTSSQPVLNFQAADAEILPGGSTTLSWNAQDANNLSIDNGIGPVPLTGSTVVTPQYTTAYTLNGTETCGAGTGPVSESVIVKVFYPACTASFTSSQSEINAGEPVTLIWATENANQVTIEPGIGTVASSGTMDITPDDDVTYVLSATGYGDSATVEAFVNVHHALKPPAAMEFTNVSSLPVLNFSVDPENVNLQPGGSTTLFWDSLEVTHLSIDNGIGGVPINGQLAVSPEFSTTYTLTGNAACGTGAILSRSVDVNVIYPDCTATLALSKTDINSGEQVTLTWNTTNATDIVIHPDVGFVAANGQVAITPSDTTTYSLSAIGHGGPASASASVNVHFPIVAPSGITLSNESSQPLLNFYVDPQNADIPPGGTTTLFWDAADITDLTIDNTIGAVSSSGQVEISPGATTTYTITGTAACGTGKETLTKSVTVDVVYPACEATLTASSTVISPGDFIILEWDLKHAQEAVITPDIGTVEPSGQRTLTPAGDTTYTITGTSACGSGSETVTKSIFVDMVYPACEATLTASSTGISAGDSITLSWNTANAKDVSITGLGTVGASGQRTITPADDTTYTITATGNGDPATAEIFVDVHFPLTSPATLELTNTSSEPVLDFQADRGIGDRQIIQ